MSTPPSQFKSPKDRRKTAPVKRVHLSADAKAAYEELARERDERERTYARHLAADNKVK